MNESTLSRRRFLRAGVGLSTFAVLAGYPTSSNHTALAADIDGWSASDVNIESSDGAISNVTVEGPGSSFDVEWSGINAPQTVTLDIRARLAKGGSFETLSTGEFTLDSAKGSLLESSIEWDTNPFPFSFIDDHSGISASDFENPTDDSTKSTPVDLRLVFDYGVDDVVYDTQFAVNVTNERSALIDSFENGDLSNYQNDKDLLNVTNANSAANGDYYLTIISDAYTSSNPNTYSPEGSGLSYYPSAGDTFRWNVRLNSPSDVGGAFAFATSGEPSSTSRSSAGSRPNEQYAVYVNGRTDSFFLRKTSGDTNTTLDETSVSLAEYASEWLEVVIDWGDDGTITATLYDGNGSEIASISGTDAEFTSGGIGWETSTTQSAGADDLRFDHARV